jgi:hypothetical protein
LALCFDTKVSPGFSESDLDLPSADEQGDDGRSRSRTCHAATLAAVRQKIHLSHSAVLSGYLSRTDCTSL